MILIANLKLNTMMQILLIAIRDFRENVSMCIAYVKDSADLQSTLDGLTDLQEEIDQFVYRFKLD